MKLKKIIEFKGTITCLSGLCIGGTNTDINIGGIDKEVIKNPVTNEPYIPGSSLKGKMRSQLEKRIGKIEKDPCKCGLKSCDVCMVFGAYRNPGADSNPTRIIVRDSNMNEETRAILAEILEETGNYLEIKCENRILRNKGTAKDPRNIERVPEGAKFDMEILLQIYEGDPEDRLKNAVRKALELVELSYLGGSGTRGYGKVRFDYEEGEIDI